MKRTIIFGIFILLLLSTEGVVAGGVGISPAYYKIFFEPGMVKSFQFHSFNSDPTKNINLYVKGDLAEYVNLSKHNLTGSGTFTATIKLPEEISVPGTHKIYIGAMESEKVSGEGVIGGIAGIQGRIDIIVPYHGKYAESSFSISDINIGEEAGYKLEVQNLGLEDITVKPTIEIYRGNTTQKLLTKNLATVNLKSKRVLNTIGTLNTRNFPAGKYYAIATIDWGKKIDKIKKIFRVGEFLVKIIDYDYLFEQNKINKFNIEIQNKWNTKINRVSADVVITDEGKVVSSFKTISVETRPWETRNITGYFDTTGLKAKRYTASIVLSYGGKTTSKLVAIYVREPPTKTYMKYIIIASTIALMIILTFIYLILKIRKLRKEKNGKKK